MARPFGLVAGLGIGAGIFYYRSLVAAHLARNLSADLLLIHADVRQVMRLATARETRELARYLTGLLTRLAKGGAEIATIPAFAPSDLRSRIGNHVSSSPGRYPRRHYQRS